MPIQVLPEHIAAGEVVEWPTSVVRLLLKLAIRMVVRRFGDGNAGWGEAISLNPSSDSRLNPAGGSALQQRQVQ